LTGIDTNILVYAHRAESPWHEKAARCVKQMSEGGLPWLIPWPCIHEFLGIVTHPRIFNPPSPQTVAFDQVQAWLDSSSLVLASETSSHWPTLQKVMHSSKAAGPMIHDARIAVICIDHGVDEFLTADRDFSRFPDLKTRNPLI
jgi:toxin-antitoxin system PIN domain toxin